MNTPDTIQAAENVHVSSELAESYESIDTHLFEGLLSGVGNHEAKLLTAAIICQNSGELFSESTLAKEMAQCQDLSQGWMPNKGVPYGYCQRSLGPIGMLVKGHAKGVRGPVEAYQASETGVKYGLPFAGALLDWSLQYPDISLQTIYGSSHSRGTKRAPAVRRKILQELLISSDQALSYADIARKIDDPSITGEMVDQNARAMKEAGIIDVESRAEQYDPVLKIEPRGFEHIALKIEELRIEAQAVYGVMDILRSRHIDVLTVSDFISELQGYYPAVDLAEARAILIEATGSKTTRLPMITLLSGATSSQRTKVSINENHKLALQDLEGRLTNLEHGNNLDFYKTCADDILNSSQMCAALMAKAKQFSSNRVAQTVGAGGLDKKIAGIIKTNTDPIPVREILVALKAENYPITNSGVVASLGRMVSSGIVSFEEVKIDPSKSTVKRLFTLASSENN